MGCEWYSFTAVSLQGIIFISKCLSEDIIKKYELIKIAMPLNVDINFISINFKDAKLEILEDTSKNTLSKRYNKIPGLKREIEDSFFSSDERTFYIEEDDYKNNKTNNSEYIYIYPCSSKLTTTIEVPGPRETELEIVSIAFSDPKELNDTHIKNLEDLKAKYSFSNEPLFNFEEYINDEKYQKFKTQLQTINETPITETSPTLTLVPKIYNIILASSSQHLLSPIC